MPSMRDVFWNRIYDYAKEDRNIVILSSDFAAPALDKFRVDLPAQFICTGISEQNTILAAAGMALEGKKPYVISIAPFIVMRCFEQTRLYAAGMNLPITIVGVGAGISYENSGPTHHAVEDIALMRTLPYMKIYQPADNAMTRLMAERTVTEKGPVYVRLDRFSGKELYDESAVLDEGMNVLREARKINLLATGNMVHVALEAADKLCEKGIQAGVVDACILPLEEKAFRALFEETALLVTMEEHIRSGGLGSNALELVSEMERGPRVRRVGFDFSQGYTHEYGGRAVVHKQFGMDAESVAGLIERYAESGC